jgi:ABC-type maltose transport system permease subunit
MITNFVAKWNDYGTSQIYLNKYPTLAYGLFLFEQKSNFGDSTKLGIYYAALIITSIPGVVLYSTMQNFVIKIMTVGGLKG